MKRKIDDVNDEGEYEKKKKRLLETLRVLSGKTSAAPASDPTVATEPALSGTPPNGLNRFRVAPRYRFGDYASADAALVALRNAVNEWRETDGFLDVSLF